MKSQAEQEAVWKFALRPHELAEARLGGWLLLEVTLIKVVDRATARLMRAAVWVPQPGEVSREQEIEVRVLGSFSNWEMGRITEIATEAGIKLRVT